MENLLKRCELYNRFRESASDVEEYGNIEILEYLYKTFNNKNILHKLLYYMFMIH